MTIFVQERTSVRLYKQLRNKTQNEDSSQLMQRSLRIFGEVRGMKSSVKMCVCASACSSLKHGAGNVLREEH